MERFRKWCYNAAQGLGMVCLWYEIGRAFDFFLNARAFGIIVGMFFLGWVYTYKDDLEREKKREKIVEEFKKELEELNNKKD